MCRAAARALRRGLRWSSDARSRPKSSNDGQTRPFGCRASRHALLAPSPRWLGDGAPSRTAGVPGGGERMSFANPELEREYQRTWRAANPERMREYQRRYKAKHLDYRAYQRTYRDAHPDRVAKWRQDGNARDRAIGRSPARSAIAHAIEDGRLLKGPCVICGSSGVEAHHHRGYEKVHHLDVVWLCKIHHEAAHHWGLRV
mgnify:CR=1 FL=1